MAARWEIVYRRPLRILDVCTRECHSIPAIDLVSFFFVTFSRGSPGLPPRHRPSSVRATSFHHLFAGLKAGALRCVPAARSIACVVRIVLSQMLLRIYEPKPLTLLSWIEEGFRYGGRYLVIIRYCGDFLRHVGSVGLLETMCKNFFP